MVLLVAALCFMASCSSSAEPTSDADNAATDQSDESGQGSFSDAGGTESSDDAEPSPADDTGTTGDTSDAEDRSEDPDSTSAQPETTVGPIVRATGDGLAGDELEEFLAKRYEAFWQVYDRARANPTATASTDYPELFELTTGERLEQVYESLAALDEAGEAIREPDVAAVPGLDADSTHRVRVDSLEDGVAVLVSCLVNDNVRYRVAGGEVLSENVVTVRTRTTMARADGTWKIIRSEAEDIQTGVGGCWLEDESSFPL